MVVIDARWEDPMSELGPTSAVVIVRGEAFVVSGPTGDITPGGEQGVYVRDTRFLDLLRLEVDGARPRHLTGASVGGTRAVFHGYLPPSRDGAVDPSVLVARRRVVADGMRERIAVSNGGGTRVELLLTVTLGTDFAYIFDVKHGRELPPARAESDGATVRFRRPGGVEAVEVRGEGPKAHAVGEQLRFHLSVDPGTTQTCEVTVSVTDPYGHSSPPSHVSVTRAPDRTAPTTSGADPRVTCSDSRFSRLVRRSLTDLQSLTLEDPEAPGDRFVAAGSPWYLTLFGRDSLWASLMALPYDLDLAGGTLRTLARRQGTSHDPETEEQPGKILHEVRRGSLSERGDLPPCYYGSVDATPLFVILAHEAWSWGLPEDQIRALVPNVEAALHWIEEYGDPDGDGLLEHVRPEGRGLANQGWKDSRDGIRFADGTIARAPMALCAVQGYAYAAAQRGADLLEALGRPGADHWRTWAATLRERFRARFWVDAPDGPYPAMALDGEKRRVDAVASNMGHLLFTGILDAEEADLVARRLEAPAMASGWGLRTLAADSGGYNPLSYHCGSVWPHDTAIAAWGLARTGHPSACRTLLRGLVRAAPSFQFRLPELFSGLPPSQSPIPVPYPAACRPQAWAAGGALLLVRSLLGAEGDVPHGRITLRPLAPAPFERFALDGIPLDGGRIDLHLDHGVLTFQTHDAPAVDVVVEPS
jgi:glycogen debranching enzyme